jgi:hypothetical protein
MVSRNGMTRGWPLIEARAIIAKCPEREVFDLLGFVGEFWFLEVIFDFFKNIRCYL